MQNRHIIVVGGGAAGMLAALFAARAGADVLLLERNEKLGKKVYITGKGRCNVTNAAEREPFLKKVYRNPRFLYAALSNLDNNKLMDLIEGLGTPLKVERGDRVFPVSDKSSDILAALRRGLDEAGVRVRFHARVARLCTEGGRISGVLLETGETIPADAVILATGGMSYPSTGSTGDGYDMAKSAGHSVTELRPALTAIVTEELWPERLAGLTLKNVALRAYVNDGKKEKRIYNEQGELLFTHFGISGPLVLTLSSLLPEDLARVRLAIDLKPALDAQTLDARLVRDFRELSRKQLATAMDGLEPHNLGLMLLELAQLSPAQPIHSVTQEQRRRLAVLMKELPLIPRALRGFDEAIITRGGVQVKEVNPSTMQSKLLPGLYLAGELLDLDAATGGFNLQIAFSTGALAGKSAATRVEEENA